jgi:hypothetical protein
MKKIDIPTRAHNGQRAALLDNGSPKSYEIHLKLQEGKTARFVYSDRFLARSHWEQLQGLGIIAGHAIKAYEFKEVADDHTS